MGNIIKLWLFFIMTSSFLALTSVVEVNGQNTYEVTALKLNVRSKPTIKASVVGSLRINELVNVDTIIKNWAKIDYKNKKCYVSSKYLKKIYENPSELSIVEEDTIKTDTLQLFNEVDYKFGNSIINSERYVKKKIGIDFVPSICFGWTNFVSDKASPKGTLGFGVDFSFQFIFNEKVSSFPKNYYMETSLGYSVRGSTAFPLHYLNVKLSPFGYRYSFSDYMIFGNLGFYVGYTFSSIETLLNSFDSELDVGVLCKIGAEYKKIGLSLSYERGLTEVCDSKLKLNNQCFFLNLSYRFLNLK